MRSNLKLFIIRVFKYGVPIHYTIIMKATSRHSILSMNSIISSIRASTSWATRWPGGVELSPSQYWVNMELVCDVWLRGGGLLPSLFTSRPILNSEHILVSFWDIFYFFVSLSHSFAMVIEPVLLCRRVFRHESIIFIRLPPHSSGWNALWARAGS